MLPRRFFALAALALIFSTHSSHAQTPDANIVAFTGARIFDGTGGAPIEHATLLICDDRVLAVGPANQVKIPAGAALIQSNGKTIIPGLINAHGHVQVEQDSKLPVRDDLLRRLKLYASYGITTVVSLGSGERDEVPGIALRNEQRAGLTEGARLYTSGRAVSGRTVAESHAAVDRLADLGVDFVKLRLGSTDDPSPEVFRAQVERAHEKGLRTAVHIFSLKDAQKAVDAGVDVIGHSVRDQDVTPEFIATLKQRNLPYIATLTRDLSVFVYESTPEFFTDPFFLRGQSLYAEQIPTLSDPAYQKKVRENPNAQSIKKALEQAERNLKLLSDGGVTIAFGTDTGTAGNPGRWQGYFEHVELELMVKAGLTPQQALVSATSAAAKAIGLNDLGTLKPGKLADFVVLNADPLADITHTREIDSVWIGGRRVN